MDTDNMQYQLFVFRIITIDSRFRLIQCYFLYFINRYTWLKYYSSVPYFHFYLIEILTHWNILYLCHPCFSLLIIQCISALLYTLHLCAMCNVLNIKEIIHLVPRLRKNCSNITSKWYYLNISPGCLTEEKKYFNVCPQNSNDLSLLMWKI